MTLSNLTGPALLELGRKLQADSERRDLTPHQQKAQVMDGVCMHCGERLPGVTMTLEQLEIESHPKEKMGMVTWYGRCQDPVCQAKDQVVVDQFTQSDQRAKDQEYRVKLEWAGISARNMAGLTFNGFLTDWTQDEKYHNDLAEALDKVNAWTRNDIGGAAILSGPYGTGKTRLAVAAMREYLKGGRSAFHVACVEAWTSIKASWDTPKGAPFRYRDLSMSESGFFDRCQTCGLLVLDDLDKVTPGAAWLERILGIVNYRVDRKTPMIITLNTPLDRLLGYLTSGKDGQQDAEALYSRLSMMVTLTIQFPADMPDFRQHIIGGE